jgi:hypothetical protein
VRYCSILVEGLEGGDWLPDDELTREWLRQVQQYREECDEADRPRLLGDAGEQKPLS